MCIGVNVVLDVQEGRVDRAHPVHARSSARPVRATVASRAPGRRPGGPTSRSGSSRPRRCERGGPGRRASRRSRRCARRPRPPRCARQRRFHVVPEGLAAVALGDSRWRTRAGGRGRRAAPSAHGAQHLRRDGQRIAAPASRASPAPQTFSGSRTASARASAPPRLWPISDHRLPHAVGDPRSWTCRRLTIRSAQPTFSAHAAHRDRVPAAARSQARSTRQRAVAGHEARDQQHRARVVRRRGGAAPGRRAAAPARRRSAALPTAAPPATPGRWPQRSWLT